MRGRLQWFARSASVVVAVLLLLVSLVIGVSVVEWLHRQQAAAELPLDNMQWAIFQG